jgi:hypothetical protein
MRANCSMYLAAALDCGGRAVEDGKEVVAPRFDLPASIAGDLASDREPECVEQVSPLLVADLRGLFG